MSSLALDVTHKKRCLRLVSQSYRLTLSESRYSQPSIYLIANPFEMKMTSAISVAPFVNTRSPM
jgi:hypothetical protein